MALREEYGMTKIHCEECEFWVEVATTYGGLRGGECHRYPAVVVKYHTNFCGEGHSPDVEADAET